MRCSSKPFPAAGSLFSLPGSPSIPATLSAPRLPRPPQPSSRRDAPPSLAGLFGKRTRGAAPARRLGHAYVLHLEDQQTLRRRCVDLQGELERRLHLQVRVPPRRG